MTVDELIEQVPALQHKEAVYSEAIAYLEEFLPSDVIDDEQPEPICAPECVVPEVPLEVIEVVLEELCLVRDALSQSLDSLKTMEISENDGRNDGEERDEKAPATGKQRKRKCCP